MIHIQQDMPEIDGLENLINKNSEVVIPIDESALDADIDSIREKINNPLSRIDRKNAEATLDYLSRIKRKIKNSSIDLLWGVNKYRLKSYPIEFKYIPEYNIEMIDYISVTEGHLLRIDYTDMLNIIAVDMAYRDLGETSESMEELLDDVGVTGIYPSSKLLNAFESNIFTICRTLQIEDSPYRATDLKITQEYFGKETFKNKYYTECLDYSAQHALAIIANKILNRLNNSGIKYALASVSNSGIYIIAKCDIDITELIKESAIVRAFGRRFEVQPRITIF